MPMVPLSLDDLDLLADRLAGSGEGSDGELMVRLRQHAAAERKAIQNRLAAREAEKEMSERRRLETARLAWRCENDHPAGASDADVNLHASQCGFDPYEVPGYPGATA